MSKARTLVTGVIGSDTHIVGNRILSMALEKAGYKVVSLGALTPAADFIKAAVETDADAIMVSSLRRYQNVRGDGRSVSTVLHCGAGLSFVRTYCTSSLSQSNPYASSRGRLS